MSYTMRQMMFEDPGNLQTMNEKVQNLATNVYKEFEVIISKHGSDIVKNLMSTVVNILENFDHNLKDKQKLEIDIELSKVEIEHLRNQCDKEKAQRRSADLKFLEMEDMVDETKKQLTQAKSSYDSSIKRMEMKVKNLQDQISRLEEKEIKSKDEYIKLHTKYSDLLKSHTDYVQKTAAVKHQEQNEAKKCLNCEKVEKFEVISNSPMYLSETLTIGKQHFNIINNVTALNANFNHNNSSNKTLESELEEDSPPSSSLLPSSLPKNSNIVMNTENITNNSPLSVTKTNDIIDSNNDLNSKVENTKCENTKSVESSLLLNENNNSHHINLNAYIDSPPDSYSSTNHSQEDLSHDNNNTVDALFGQCIFASNTGIGKKSFTTSLDDNFRRKEITEEETFSLRNNLYSDEHLKNMLEIEEDMIMENNNGSSNSNLEYDPVKNVSLYEELSILDEDVGADLVSVGAEVDKLIQENAELLATKNALNVLKDDLIADVEELSGEVELLKEEIQSLNENKLEQSKRIADLEEELKKSKEEINQIRIKYEEEQQNEMGKTMFSRGELIRVLMERNQYKEKWMELQEAVKYAETVRASRAHPELMTISSDSKKSRTSAVWGYFNSFLGRERDDGS